MNGLSDLIKLAGIASSNFQKKNDYFGGISGKRFDGVITTMRYLNKIINQNEYYDIEKLKLKSRLVLLDSQ